MASVVNRPNGHKWIQFKDLAGRRQTIRLGRVPKSYAGNFRERIEWLLAAAGMGQPVDLDTAKWVGSLPPDIYARLAATGLVQSRPVATLGELVDDFRGSLAVKDATLRNIGVVLTNLRTFFGSAHLLAAITEADAKRFRAWLTTSGGRDGAPLASTTVSRRTRRAKQLFEYAVQKRWLTDSPFATMAQWNEVNRERDFFVTPEIVAAILDAIPDVEFRTVVVLARYGGLRSPSEVRPLKWGDVNWEHQTLRVTSPKNAHHSSQAIRLVPLFPEMQDALEDLWAVTPEGAAVVLPHLQVTGAALTNRLEGACRAAGIVLWPRPWQNMRASRETELLEDFPIQTVAAWIGHSPTVALKHYAQVAKDHVARAVKLRKSVLRSPQRVSKAKQNPKLRRAP